ncbi:MAG: Rv2175c family DNA-binding protein [Leucobacter sp.]
MAPNFPSDIEYVTVPELVERWGMSPSKVHRLIEDHHLAAVKIDGVLRVPADFAQHDGPLHSLRGTLLALLDAGFSDEEALSWLLEENEELGERPISALLAGRKSAVRRATQALAF